jgi:hypothetical protein
MYILYVMSHEYKLDAKLCAFSMHCVINTNTMQ